MANSYWNTVLQSRLARRRMLAATGSTALGAAILAACGGSDDGANTDQSALLTVPKDTIKQAKRGGVIKDYVAVDLRTWDPHILDIAQRPHMTKAYQTLVKSIPTANKEVVPEDQFGDAAESWEVAPDKLSVTFKLRADNKFDPRPPTNGRAMTAEDVAIAWTEFSQKAILKSDFSNVVNPDSPIASITAVDARTVQVKLAKPNADIMLMLALESSGNFHLIAKEAFIEGSGGFDRRSDMRGSGPFYVSDYVQSSRIVYKRNPGYYNKELPYADGIEMPIIPEYAAALAQFTAGNLWTFPVRAEDIVGVKRANDALVMYPTDVTVTSWNTWWGYTDDPKNYFRDERVRQAYAYAQDRDLWIDTLYNTAAFTSQGLPVDTRWNATSTLASRVGWWLDPKSKDFGDNAKYYKHDVAEAKKLLAAAGHPNGFDFDANYIPTAYYGVLFPKAMELLLGMALEAGMRGTTIASDPNTDWRPKFFDAKGKFVGIAAGQNSGGTNRNSYYAQMNPGGSQFRGFAADNTDKANGDPRVTELQTKIREEFDVDKAQSYAHELQRYEAPKQYNPFFPGGASGFGIGWPAIGNLGVFRMDFPYRMLWVDDTKAPIKTS